MNNFLLFFEFFSPLSVISVVKKSQRYPKIHRKIARMRYTCIGCVAVLLILCSCFKPNYQRPCLDLPEHWRMPADEGSTLCNYRWWEQFEDPVLNQLIILALQNNQDLKVAISRAIEYYALVGITNAALWPQLTGNLNYNRSESSVSIPLSIPPGVPRIDNNYQASFNLSWELDFWGRLLSASEASYADLFAQVEARRAFVLSLVSSVANDYIILRSLDAQLEISKNTLTSRLESLKLAEDRFNLGETSQIEVRQAESEVEIAAIRVIEFERAIPQQENLLSVLIGENPRHIERGLTIESFQRPLEIPAGLPSDLLTRRPDIMQAEDLLIATNARITEARALFFPQISLTSMYGSQSDQIKSFLTSPAEMWSYGLTAIQTIFDAGQIVYRVKVAEARREEALHAYKQTILNAFREVEDSLIAYKKNLELVYEHRRQVRILKDYLKLATLRYNEGEIDYLNVLDAERSLFDAELQLAQAHADSFMAIVDLYGALGGGWVVDADDIALASEQ